MEMAKPKLIKSPMKAIHQAITRFRPSAQANCIKDAGGAGSFRGTIGVAGEVEEPCASSNSMCYTPPSSSTTGSKSYCSNDFKEEDMKGINVSGAEPELAVLRGPANVGRFFFSPRSTKSIMEEAKAEHSASGMAETGAAAPGFYEESTAMALASNDPYWDFRVSMEEMVEAHQLREWPRLQELLQCYLRLNEKKTHRTIVLAFVDLLMQLMAPQDNKDDDHEL